MKSRVQEACAITAGPASVSITLTSPEPRLTVPVSALRRGPTGAPECVRVVDGHAVIAAVTTGLRDSRVVEILDGLAEGDRVVADDPVGNEDGSAIESLP